MAKNGKHICTTNLEAVLDALNAIQDEAIKLMGVTQIEDLDEGLGLICAIAVQQMDIRNAKEIERQWQTDQDESNPTTDR